MSICLPTIRRVVFLTFSALVCSGCGDEDGATGSSGSGGAGGSSSSGVSDEVCVEQSEVEGRLHCSKPFAAPPFVHLPADTASTAYVVFDLTAVPGVFRKRDGSTFPLDDSKFAAELTEADNATLVVPRAHSVYRATLTGGSVSAISPFVYIDQIATLEASYAGKTLEGLISRRTGPGAFDGVPSLPIRVTVGTPTLREEFHSTAHSLLTLENATTGKLSADGPCMPALTAYGSENPWSELDLASFDLWLSAGMHGQFDDHLVVGGAMGEGGRPDPVFMTAVNPALEPFVGNFVVGSPGSYPILDFHVVTSGGADCVP